MASTPALCSFLQVTTKELTKEQGQSLTLNMATGEVVQVAAGKLGQTSTNFQVKRGKSASLMGIDDSLPGNAAPHLEFFD